MLSSAPPALLTQPGFHCISALLAKAGGGFPSSFGRFWEAPVRAVLFLGWLLSSTGGAESSAPGQVGSTGVAGKKTHRCG